MRYPASKKLEIIRLVEESALPVQRSTHQGRRGLTQRQLAERLGVTHHTIRSWEKGERAVRKAWRFKLADALSCSVADLRKGEAVVRGKRWRRALVNLSGALSNASPARSRDAKE